MDEPHIQILGPDPRLPLPLYEECIVGRLQMPDGSAYVIQAGLGHHLIAELQAHSRDESDTELQSQTSDRKRFVEGSYEKWYAKERTPFALIARNGSLAALIWFGPEAYPESGASDHWDTIAFRSYPPYRGKRLMTPFSRSILDMHHRIFPERRLWLETNPGNAAGTALYKKLGFTEVLRPDCERLLMVQSS